MGLLSRFGIGRAADRVPVNSDQREPITPFEYWEKSPDFLELPPRLFRPIIYLLQHQVLPEAFWRGDPVIGEVFWEKGDLKRFWWRSAQRAVQEGRWSPLILRHDGITAYIDALRVHATISHRVLRDVALWTITMPDPVDVIECHFVSLCLPKDNLRDASGEEVSRRYFTLERSSTPAEVVHCDWFRGTHRNFGRHAAMSLRQFEEACVSRMHAGRGPGAST